MATKKKNTDDEQAHGAGADDGEGVDFFDTECARYGEVVGRSVEEAFDRYGFTLYHSLPPARQVEIAERAGILRDDAVDHFNLGGVAVEKGDFAGAVKHYKTALDKDGAFADAAFNQALCFEKLGKTAEAKSAWNRYLEHGYNDDDRRAVEAHLKDL